MSEAPRFSLTDKFLGLAIERVNKRAVAPFNKKQYLVAIHQEIVAMCKEAAAEEEQEELRANTVLAPAPVQPAGRF